MNDREPSSMQIAMQNHKASTNGSELRTANSYGKSIEKATRHLSHVLTVYCNAKSVEHNEYSSL